MVVLYLCDYFTVVCLCCCFEYLCSGLCLCGHFECPVINILVLTVEVKVLEVVFVAV